MSGGSLDYAFINVNNAIEDIEICLSEYEDLDEEVVSDIRLLLPKLNSLSEYLKAVEWYLSGDTGINDYMEASIN